MGKNIEIDIYAGAGPEHWIVECKWYSDLNVKVGLNKVKAFFDLKPVVLDHEGEGIDDLNKLLDLPWLKRLPNLSSKGK